MAHVPTEFQPLLASSPVENLDSERDKKYIIQRFLRNATLDAWRWMLKMYDKEDIAEVIKTSRTLRERDVRFWSHYLNIPEKEIVCLQKKSPSPLKTSWAH